MADGGSGAYQKSTVTWSTCARKLRVTISATCSLSLAGSPVGGAVRCTTTLFRVPPVPEKVVNVIFASKPSSPLMLASDLFASSRPSLRLHEPSERAMSNVDHAKARLNTTVSV